MGVGRGSTALWRVNAGTKQHLLAVCMGIQRAVTKQPHPHPNPKPSLLEELSLRSHESSYCCCSSPEGGHCSLAAVTLSIRSTEPTGQKGANTSAQRAALSAVLAGGRAPPHPLCACGSGGSVDAGRVGLGQGSAGEKTSSDGAVGRQRGGFHPSTSRVGEGAAQLLHDVLQAHADFLCFGFHLIC